jgi:hypothetical protein
MKLLAPVLAGLVLAVASPTGPNTNVAASKYMDDGTHTYAIIPHHPAHK